MKTMPAGEFKARCLAIMEDVSKTREPVVITKRGKPVAKLVPAEKSERPFIGRLEGIVRITGNIESPIEPRDAWEARRGSYGPAMSWSGGSRIQTDGRGR